MNIPYRWIGVFNRFRLPIGLAREVASDKLYLDGFENGFGEGRQDGVMLGALGGVLFGLCLAWAITTFV